jgi:D-glycero-D-manno-heptose 1,7-bisphosphate phosphatase
VQAVFLDRDGTINVEKGYMREVAQVELIAGAAQAIRKLNDAGILAILTTNQTGPARGFYDEAHVRALNSRVAELLAEEAGARLDAIFYCPHLEKGVVAEYAVACSCRKPGPGMIEQACVQFPEIDLSQSYVAGDKASDVAFAEAVGCRGILLKTGYGQRVLEGKYQVLTVQPWRVCEDLPEAVEAIMAERSTSATAPQPPA